MMISSIKKIIVSVMAFTIYMGTMALPSQSIGIPYEVKLDPSIRYGQLPNGFTYYIKGLSGSSSKLSLKLYVKSGFLQQDSDQMNMAHAVEHLAFKPSKNLPQGIYEYLGTLEGTPVVHRNLGGSAGPRVTTYDFNAPANNNTALQAGLLWFREIATGLKLSELDIDRERGVLCQELIHREGDNLEESFLVDRLKAKLLPGHLDQTNFFEHHETFPAETLRRFYRDWYRPELMALSIVGSVADVDALEKQIIQRFSDIPPHKEPRKLVDCDALYYGRPPQFVGMERKPDTLKKIINKDVLFRLLFRDPRTKATLHGREGANRLMTWNLLERVLRDRLKSISEVYNASIRVNSLYTYKLDKAPCALMVNITTQHHKEKEGLLAAIKILQQLKKYGVSQEEWDMAKNESLQALRDNDLENPKYWIGEIRQHFGRGEALPDHKNDMMIKWLSELSLEGFNKMIFGLIGDMPEDIGIIAPEGHRALSYTEDQLRSWIRKTCSGQISPFTFPKKPLTLMDHDNKLGMSDFLDQGTDISGSREILLENGAKVVLKSFEPSPGIHAGKILLHGFSSKGASCFPQADYFSAIYAPTIVQNTGVGELDKFQLKNFLSGTSMEQGVRPYIDFMDSGITGNASIKDMETLLQLVHLYFTNPRKDVLAFEDWKKIEENSYQDPSYSLVLADFKNKIRESVGNYSVTDESGAFSTRQLLGTKRYQGLDKTDLNKVYAIYQEIFGNPQDFTFLISGDFEMKSVLPLVQKYLGNLPKLKSSLKCKTQIPDTSSLANGPLFKKIPAPKMYKMKNVLYSLKFIKKADEPYNWQEEFKVRVLGVVTNMKVRSLRYEKRLSLYNMSALGRFEKALSRYEISLQLDCVTKELAEVQKECKRIIQEMKSGMVTQEMLEQSIMRLYYLYDENITGQHEMVQNKLYEHFRNQSTWLEPNEIEQFLKSLTVEDIVATANKYFDQENSYEFVMSSD
jgi:predicted Zn-dependent peptidase